MWKIAVVRENSQSVSESGFFLSEGRGKKGKREGKEEDIKEKMVVLGAAVWKSGCSILWTNKASLQMTIRKLRTAIPKATTD